MNDAGKQEGVLKVQSSSVFCKPGFSVWKNLLAVCLQVGLTQSILCLPVFVNQKEYMWFGRILSLGIVSVCH